MSEGKGCLSGSFTALGAAGAMLQLLNPEGADLIITNFIVRSTVVSTGAATMDAGVHATGLTNDELSDGLDINAAVRLESNHDQVTAAVVAEHEVLWPATAYLVAYGSAATTGFVGTYYCEYIRA
jgi:hypothetical protein